MADTEKKVTFELTESEADAVLKARINQAARRGNSKPFRDLSPDEQRAELRKRGLPC